MTVSDHSANQPALSSYRYLLLSTLKKNGEWVATPVWFAGDDEFFYVFSAGNAGKVKRLNNFNSVKLAGCTVTGKPLSTSCDSIAWLVNDNDLIRHANQVLNLKYGWQKWLLDCGAKLSGKYSQRQYIKIVIPKDHP